MPEEGNVQEQFGSIHNLLDLHRQHGSHTVGIDYVGLEYFVRVRYIGDRMPAYPQLFGFMSANLRQWIKNNNWQGRYLYQLDYSYAYAWTRKGTFVRVNGLDDPIVCISERTIHKTIVKSMEDLLRAARRNPATMQLDNAVSFQV